MKIEIQRNRSGSVVRTAQVPEDFWDRADKLGSMAEGTETPEYYAREVGEKRWVGFRVDPETAHVPVS